MSFVAHLEELRRRIFVCLGVWIAASLVTYYFNDDILHFLARPVGRLVFLSPAEAFLARLKIAFYTGCLLALPVILWEIWRFVVSALTITERRVLLWVLPCSYGLFLAGAAFCLFVVAPKALHFLLGAGDSLLRPAISIQSYLQFMLFFALSFGVVFQMPLVFFFLAKVGIVYPELLQIYRKQAVVMILLVAAVLTPGPDVFSQAILAVPMYLLYEISIRIAWLAVKRP